MLTEVRPLLERALAESPAEATEFVFIETNEDFTRFGANAITQNLMKASRSLSIRVQQDFREARVDISQITPESIAKGIQEALEVASFRSSDANLLPMLDTPQTIREVVITPRAESGPEQRADAVLQAIAACKEQDSRASGICASTEVRTIVLNSKGVVADGLDRWSEFSLTAEREDGAGWAKTVADRHSDLDLDGCIKRALDKGLASRKPRAIKPGNYPVVLEAAAVADLIKMLPWMAFNALDYLEGRNFAVGRLGEKFWDAKLSVYDDVWEAHGLPFDYEGVAKKRTALIEQGVFVGLAHDRFTARMAGVEPTGHGNIWPNTWGPSPNNISVSAGDTPLADVIAGLDQGLLVTQLHYLNIVDRMDLSVTGMTRNGTFWVEKGKIVHPVENMRFTDSLLTLLGTIDAVSIERERAAAFWDGTIVAPTIRLPRMHFSSPAGF